ncbi:MULTISPECIES: response regulator transcription factor [unclassified Leptolyngbya]|uniref:response regulator n=1 Tax=unclassified Leptolyngbya TaxID=2650499 RepID=UPI001684D30A|nr:MULTISPECIES: response regulator transcription factor [unclassified Leptolyngbya]MBD1909743.1 response regulator transcription factor [Leptolyngbya sp. FACHB-8]MBD2155736.1 response regulator transcription factor [Leptolyngbya sp. FACHB-16]
MIRVLLVDNQGLVRDGIKALLNHEPDLAVVGTAENGREALEQIEVTQPDIVLTDLSMPVMGGKETTQAIAQRFPTVKVLILSTCNDTPSVIEALYAGAKGYLLKTMIAEELADSIRLVHRGYTQLAPGLMEKILDQALRSGLSRGESELPAIAELSARERDVLRLIGKGATNSEIAQQLFISEGTVKTYVTRLFTRLNFRNRSELAIYANSVEWHDTWKAESGGGDRTPTSNAC